MKNFFLFFILLLGFSTSIFALKAPIKYGKVSEEELKMNVYDIDSSASAIILCDYGYFNLNDYYFTRTIRIKILKKEGLYLANDIYPGAAKTEIRGKTFNLENGEVIVTKLKNESIFKERVHEDYYRLRVAMPNVKVGSVFDIEFRQFFPPAIWYFQREIPVKWSELIMPNSQYFDLQRRFTGYESLFINTNGRWVAKDVPAFKEEPFINSSENYITKFEINIKSIHIPGVLIKEYATNWNAVARRLKESKWFGYNLDAAMYLNSAAKQIKEQNQTDFAKLEAAYAEMKKIKWDKHKSLYVSFEDNLGHVYRDGIGNCADINIMLVNLLNKLDISAYPIILSTRSNGILSQYQPNRSRLNYVIAYTKIGEKEYFLDATDADIPIGMLPRRCLNGLAQIVDDEIAKGVQINTDRKDKSIEILNLQLNEDFSLTGKYSSKREGYNAYDLRKKYHKFDSEEAFIKNREDNFPGLRINNYSAENLGDINNPIKETSELSIENMVFEIDEKLYLNPLLHLQMEENPFKLVERKYPVDFTVASSKSLNLTITLPEGYSVEEVPATLRLGLPDKAASVLYSIQVIGSKININYKLKINKPIFYVNEYTLLKEFYSQIIKKHSEPIIIKKS